jgi:hypothetical protein
MKKQIFASLAFLFAMEFTAMAQPGFPMSVTARTQNMSTVIAQGAPYTYVIKVDVSAANWGRPANVIVSGIYFARFTTVKFKPTNGDTLSMPFDSLYGMPIAVDSIYTTGTDAASRAGKIFVICNKRN